MSLPPYQFTVTIPPGTALATPQVTDLSFPPRRVDRIEVKVPAGPKGHVGFWLGAAGTQVVPVTPGQWIVTDNEPLAWDLEGQHTSGSWQMVAYNTGHYAHTLQVRILTSFPPTPAPSGPPTLLSPSELGSWP